MYWEMNMQHHLPHFHAYYQDAVASFSIDPVEMLAGELPRKQTRLVEAWAELHQDELLDIWSQMKSGEPSQPIAPLK